MFALLPLLLVPALSPVQEESPAPLDAAPAVVQEAAPQSSDPAAVAFLRAVAKAQFASEERRLVDGFQLKVFLRERGEHPHDVGFRLDFDQRGGEHLGLRIDDPERGQIDKGFDGRDYWLREDDGERQLLNGHEYEKDRASIDEALDLCQDLLLLLDVAQLESRSRALTLEQVEGDKQLLRGELRRADGNWVPFLLEVASLEGQLQAQRLDLGTPPAAEETSSTTPSTGSGEEESQVQGAGPEATQALPFQRYRLLQWKDYEGRQIPQVVRIFARPEADALPERILEIHDFSCQTHWAAQPPQR